MKQIDCQIFLQKRWIYLELREMRFGFCNYDKMHASPHLTREGEGFYREVKKVGKAIVNSL